MSYTAGRCCLLVEDDVLVGMDLEDGLREAGFDVRWVASAQSALAVLQTASPDVAVLDVIVRAEPCTSLASELKRRGIPFLVHSGLPRVDAMTEFQDAPWVEKPADTAIVVSALAEALDAPADRAGGTATVSSLRSQGWTGRCGADPDPHAISRSYSSSAVW